MALTLLSAENDELDNPVKCRLLPFNADLIEAFCIANRDLDGLPPIHAIIIGEGILIWSNANDDDAADRENTIMRFRANGAVTIITVP